MNKMRTILKDLMDKAGHTPYDIQRITGLPAATTYRFLSGGIEQPKNTSIREWAKVYGVTEAQLRGDVPIDGMEVPSEQLSLKELLTLDEYKLVSNVKALDSASKDIVYKMAARLAEPQSAYCGQHSNSTDDHRTSDYSTQLRISKSEMYTPPLVQRRLKNQNEQKAGGKNTRTA